MTRRRLTNLQRLAVFDRAGGKCHLCGAKITVKDRWDLDHMIPLALGGADQLANLAPAHDTCHRTKTATIDVPAIAKSDRVRSSHVGAKVKGAWGCGRRTKWKKRMNGETVRRAE